MNRPFNRYILARN